MLIKSKTAVDKQSEEEIAEQLKLVYLEYQMSQYIGTTIDIQTKLREIYGNETTASLENEKITAIIKGKKYDYNISTGYAGKHIYVDPFNYGTGKTKADVISGDEISLTKGTVTEYFTVVSNTNGKIVAMPKYNITLTTDHPVQSSTAGSTTFSSSPYWTEPSGWNARSKVKDGSVNIDMTEKNTPEENQGEWTYKNNIQKYIDAYKETLEDMGAEEINVRAATKPELNSELGDGLETALTDTQKQNIRNPGKTGAFWLGSGNSGDVDVFLVKSSGLIDLQYCNWGFGVRPVIEIL